MSNQNKQFEKRVQYGTRIKPSIISFLRNQENFAARILEEAVIAYAKEHGLKGLEHLNDSSPESLS